MSLYAGPVTWHVAWRGGKCFGWRSGRRFRAGSIERQGPRSHREAAGRNAQLKSLSRIEWFCYVKELLFPPSFSESGGESGQKVRDLLESSNNTVLSTYARVWKALSSPASVKADGKHPARRKP